MCTLHHFPTHPSICPPRQSPAVAQLALSVALSLDLGLTLILLSPSLLNTHIHTLTHADTHTQLTDAQHTRSASGQVSACEEKKQGD